MSESAGPAAAGLHRIELHTHLEGSITPDRLIKLASKYGQPGLPGACLNQDGSSYRSTGFHGFLELFKKATSVLRSPADFHALALDLGEQLRRDQVGYAEVTVSYGVLLRREIDPVPVQEALHEAQVEIEETHGTVLRWIPDAVRQWGTTEASRSWEAAARCGRPMGVVGFGLGGDETAALPGRFGRLFAEVRQEGLGVSIHAGEVPAMGAAARRSIREAIVECGAQRIGHGLAAATDPHVLELLAAREVFVELCPGSNTRTGAIARVEDFPLNAFLEHGVLCNLNTDDRTLFGLDLDGEYAAAAAHMGLTPEQVSAMQKAARKAAFSPVETS